MDVFYNGGELRNQLGGGGGGSGGRGGVCFCVVQVFDFIFVFGRYSYRWVDVVCVLCLYCFFIY